MTQPPTKIGICSGCLTTKKQRKQAKPQLLYLIAGRKYRCLTCFERETAGR